MQGAIGNGACEASVVEDTTASVMELEKRYVLGMYKRAPFVIERGAGCTVWDTEGRAYLDCMAGVAVNALGYNDPGIAGVIADVMSRGVIHTSNLFHTAPHAQLAQLLCTTSFADKVHYCNSGAEATEGAFKFARRYGRAHGGEKKVEFLAFSNGFHGRTMGALAATPRPQYQDNFRPLMPGVRFATFNDLESARAQMDETVCGIIVEPVQGEGGIHAATTEFLMGLRALADQYGALLIFDEVQCGVGRTGNLWAYQGACAKATGCGCSERCGVEPDIMTAAKPLAAGLPMGAILTRQKVADVMQPGDHGSTFAGGVLVASVAHHVVGRIAQPEFLKSVREKGELLRRLLRESGARGIVEVRGRGLMVGLELDREVAGLLPRFHAEGLLLVAAGARVVRFVPPLCISEEEICTVVERVTRVLNAG